jgi:plastocyanin
MVYRGPGRRPLAVALALILVLSLFGIGSAAVRSPSSHLGVATGTSAIAVTASSGFQFNPNEVAYVDTNTSITLTFTNGDSNTHSFTISSVQGTVIPSSFTFDQLTAYFAQHPPLFSILGAGPSKQVVNFTSPPIGWYEFVCNQSGHFEEGMYGFIAFGEALPSNLTVSLAPDGPGAAVFIIVGTIVALTVIAIILGFVVGRRKGAIHEMPPERLGYPEPKLPSEPAPPPGSPPKGR